MAALSSGGPNWKLPTADEAGWGKAGGDVARKYTASSSEGNRDSGMPKIYRVMVQANAGPAIGQERNMLGARPGFDIPLQFAEGVLPSTGGLSVNSCPCTIPPTLAPRELNHLIPGATRPNVDGRRLWSHGQGTFILGQVADGLLLRPQESDNIVDRQKGYVEPDSDMVFQEYQQAIASTQTDWNIDEQRNSGCPICGQP